MSYLESKYAISLALNVLVYEIFNIAIYVPPHWTAWVSAPTSTASPVQLYRQEFGRKTGRGYAIGLSRKLGKAARAKLIANLESTYDVNCIQTQNTM